MAVVGAGTGTQNRQFGTGSQGKGKGKLDWDLVKETGLVTGSQFVGWGRGIEIKQGAGGLGGAWDWLD